MPHPDTRTDWRARLLERNTDIQRLLGESRRIAVLGIKVPESYEPAYYVPRFMQQAGYEIIPVPVYYPEVEEILGERVYRRLVDIPGEIDLVNIFRRPADIPPHLDDILAKRPRAVWMQSGIRHRQVAETLAREGIEVVQDRCLMVEQQVFAR